MSEECCENVSPEAAGMMDPFRVTACVEWDESNPDSLREVPRTFTRDLVEVRRTFPRSQTSFYNQQSLIFNRDSQEPAPGDWTFKKPVPLSYIALTNTGAC